MSHLESVRTVAGWEFRRYFKWRDQVIGLVLFLVVSGGFYGVSRLLGGGRTWTVGLAGIELVAPEGSRLRFVAAPADSAARAEALGEGDLGGILERRPDGSFELLVAKRPRHEAELTRLVADVVRRERLAATGLDETVLARVLTPPAFLVRYTDPERGGRQLGELIVAGVVVGMFLMTFLTGMAYLFTGITGEKQLRVTESVLTAISPQAWIDGKVLGLTGFALVGVVQLAIGSALLLLVAGTGENSLLARIPGFQDLAVRPVVVLVTLVAVGLGLLLRNSVIAGFASTIDDPNTSSRSALMMLPVVPIALSIAVFKDADSALSRFLALFPFSSVPALPVRMVLSDPGWIEVIVSLLLLVATVWAVRRVAGRIFEVGMLMYGAEPSFREIIRWARIGRAGARADEGTR